MKFTSLMSRNLWSQNILAQFTFSYFCDTGVGPFVLCHPYVRDIGSGEGVGGRGVVLWLDFSFEGICVTILNPPLIGDT